MPATWPWNTSPVRSGNYRPLFKKFFFYGLIPCILILGYCGVMPAEEPYVMLSQLAAAYYFAHFLIILPIISKIEKPLPLPNSITESVLGGKNASNVGSTNNDPVGALAGNAA